MQQWMTDTAGKPGLSVYRHLTDMWQISHGRASSPFPISRLWSSNYCPLITLLDSTLPYTSCFITLLFYLIKFLFIYLFLATSQGIRNFLDQGWSP